MEASERTSPTVDEEAEKDAGYVCSDAGGEEQPVIPHPGMTGVPSEIQLTDPVAGTSSISDVTSTETKLNISSADLPRPSKADVCIQTELTASSTLEASGSNPSIKTVPEGESQHHLLPEVQVKFPGHPEKNVYPETLAAQVRKASSSVYSGHSPVSEDLAAASTDDDAMLPTAVVTSAGEVESQHLPEGLQFILAHVVPEDVQFQRIRYDMSSESRPVFPPSQSEGQLDEPDIGGNRDDDEPSEAMKRHMRRRRRRRPQRQVSCDPDLMPRATKGSIGGPRPPAKVLQSRAIPLAHAHISRHSSHLTTTPQPREPSRDQLTPLAAAPPHLSERDEEDEEEEESSSEEEEGSPLPGMGGLRHTSGKQKAILAVLALNDMLATMALSILAPFFPKEARLKGISNTMSGWIFGVFALVQCLTSPIFGKVLPRVGARFMCQAGQFFNGGCTLLFGALQFLPENHPPTLFVVYCLVLRIFMAVGSAATNTASFAIAANTFPDNPATVFGLLETAVGFGLMIGPALGGILYEVGHFVAPFAVIGGLMVLSVPLCLAVLPPQLAESDSADEASLKELLSIPAVSITALAAFIASVSWVMPDPTLEPHLAHFELSATIVGLVFLLMAACYAVCSPIWGWVADNVPDSSPMMVIGFLGTSAGFMLLGPCPLFGFSPSFSPLWLNIMALILIGLMVSLALVPTYDKILDAAEKAGIPDTMGYYSLVAGIWNASYSFGEFVGPVLAGWMMTSVGFPWTMTVASALCLFMAVVMLILYMYERKFGPTGVKTKTQEPINGPSVPSSTANERTPLLRSSSAPGMVAYT